MTKPLYKTTMIIWSPWDPGLMPLEDLIYEAMDGEAYLADDKTVLIENPEQDPHWDGTQFFEEDNDT